METFALLETVAISLTCVLVLIGWQVAAALRVAQVDLDAEALADQIG